MKEEFNIESYQPEKVPESFRTSGSRVLDNFYFKPGKEFYANGLLRVVIAHTPGTPNGVHTKDSSFGADLRVIVDKRDSVKGIYILCGKQKECDHVARILTKSNNLNSELNGPHILYEGKGVLQSCKELPEVCGSILYRELCRRMGEAPVEPEKKIRWMTSLEIFEAIDNGAKIKCNASGAVLNYWSSNYRSEENKICYVPDYGKELENWKWVKPEVEVTDGN